jgi:hypothetical protein
MKKIIPFILLLASCAPKETLDDKYIKANTLLDSMVSIIIDADYNLMEPNIKYQNKLKKKFEEVNDEYFKTMKELPASTRKDDFLMHSQDRLDKVQKDRSILYN